MSELGKKVLSRKNELLRIENLSILVNNAGKERLLLKDFNLNLNTNQILPITGSSGSGKSTLLRAIVRMQTISNGSIIFKGENINRISPPTLRSKISLLSQTPTFTPGSVYQNLEEPFGFKNIQIHKPEKEQLKVAVNDLGLNSGILDANVELLSGGEAQRIALARLLILNPTILLLDEATANLDPKSSSILTETVKTWVSEGERAVIWVVHDNEVIRRLNVNPLEFPSINDDSRFDEVADER